jgi:hypothetical protein
VSRWRPSPAEERWLAVAAELGDALPRAAIAERSGGWRSTGLLARCALFVLGVVATALLFAILGAGETVNLLVAGLIATAAAEWLSFEKRLHASGIEEGLTVAGFLLIGGWIVASVYSHVGTGWGSWTTLLLIGAVGAAGLRRLNPFVTTCAAIAFVSWASSTDAANALDRKLGADLTTLVLGCTLVATALHLGARQYQRPSHDRMLDWLVATLPVASYAHYASWGAFMPGNDSGPDGWARVVAILLLAALGAAMLWTGLQRRRHAPLWGFLGCVAGIALELRGVLALAPETWLIVSGLALLVAGVLLERYLREPRNGVTSVALTQREGPLDLLQIAGTALLAKHVAPESRPAEATYEGGGGRFGGGGASGSF